jgi:hypothetical protein
VVHYRLYFLNSQGRIRHALDLECDDDAHAIATVQEHIDGGAMELWQARRQVMTFGARPDPTDPTNGSGN